MVWGLGAGGHFGDQDRAGDGGGREDMSFWAEGTAGARAWYDTEAGWQGERLRGVRVRARPSSVDLKEHLAGVQRPDKSPPLSEPPSSSFTTNNKTSREGLVCDQVCER